ncbi:MAG: hypothetical protein IPK96_18890 [Flammeovirgaceae bacterium]|nr:hypothetical protein [Flammeovirgaceae bacterium]MBP9925635.1 hypothetical protein [Cyclobacteriaceae bacterium]
MGFIKHIIEVGLNQIKATTNHKIIITLCMCGHSNN